MQSQLPTRAPWRPDDFELRLIPIGALVLVGSILWAAPRFAGLEHAVFTFVANNGALRFVGACLVGFSVLGLALHRLTAAAPSMLTSVAGACGTGLGLGAFVLPAYPVLAILLSHDARIQGLVVFGLVTLVTLVVWVSEPPRPRPTPPFPLAVLRQQNSYDYTLGEWRPEDWENGENGPSEWLIWPESGTYCNLWLLGDIGSGKTTQLNEPLLIQAMGKFPHQPDKQVSIVYMDYKGNGAARLYEWAKELGRADDFYIIRPDVFVDEENEPVIPPDRYRSFSMLQGFDDPGLLASEFQDALEGTKDRRSPDYFQIVQKEFLTHALTVLLHNDPRADLADLQAFAASDDVRKVLLNVEVTPELRASLIYFNEEFGKFSAQDQASLMRGLAGQLNLLTNKAMRRAFCPTRQGSHAELSSWTDCLLTRSGIVVFSCPPALYTLGLSRLLGQLVLKSFQRSMTQRSDKAFSGNRERPVMLNIDEAHAFVNRDMGTFLAVSREARVVNVLATQSISQIPIDYREEVMGGCRTKVLLAVNDETARSYEHSLGTVTEVSETVSFSEGHRAPGTSGGRGGGLSATRSHSFTRKERPRFSAHRLRHIPIFRGVAHIFDGEKLRPSCAFKTMPWYRLPFYLLDVSKHPALACAPRLLHRYTRAKGGTLECKVCHKSLKQAWEISDYRAVLPVVRRMMKQPLPDSGHVGTNS